MALPAHLTKPALLAEMARHEAHEAALLKEAEEAYFAETVVEIIAEAAEAGEKAAHCAKLLYLAPGARKAAA